MDSIANFVSGTFASISGGNGNICVNRNLRPNITALPQQQKYRLVSKWSNGETTTLQINFKIVNEFPHIDLKSSDSSVEYNAERYPECIVRLRKGDTAYHIALLMPPCDSNRTWGMDADCGEYGAVKCTERIWQTRSWTTPANLADA